MPNLLNETSGMLAFVRTVESGSFSAAARNTNTTPSAISRSVARLEKLLGTRLFLRSTRALTLTQDGQQVFEHISPLLRELDSTADVIGSSNNLSGRLRVTMPGELAPLLLPGIFSRFAVKYPALHLQIGLTDRFVNLVSEDYDVAFRVGYPTEGDLIVRKLAEMPMVLAASPDLIKALGQPASLEDLERFPFVRFLVDRKVSPVRFCDGTTFTPSGRIDCDSGTGLLQAVHSGLGAVYLLRCLVAEDLEEGRLVELLPEIALPKLPLNALHAFGKTVPMRVKVLCEFVASEARQLAEAEFRPASIKAR
ncbi:LysR family transcriptional regulator [Roseovarius sp. B08]|uniref:LysR family transcriptional regulator n=1 Tax=Roseovarius sp. B08 TaxID=3449223 RepID=UPI003EDB91B5